MIRLPLALALTGFAAATAAAQTKPPPSSAAGSASVQTQLKALHYKDVQGLRRGPDGQWTGKATQNGVEKNVTVSPQGPVTAR
ncbi:hypothetical protein BH11PSE3_BH11PSE3_19570 [soil metagenome]